jgi:hypothetical protein
VLCGEGHSSFRPKSTGVPGAEGESDIANVRKSWLSQVIFMVAAKSTLVFD